MAATAADATFCHNQRPRGELNPETMSEPAMTPKSVQATSPTPDRGRANRDSEGRGIWS
jgi:hypothetical protein